MRPTLSTVATFELLLSLLVAIICLELAAKWLRLPPAASFIIGGGALTFIPRMPALQLNSELVLTLFLPPLLMSSAYFTAWREFRRNLGGILTLALGAVAFTTFTVGLAVHWLRPELPWAACFALGAVVSPPDAVAAKAVLERVSLPRRLVALLEGESLLNDAAGIVLLRFATAAALTGTFSFWDATTTFAELTTVGVLTGVATGFAGVALLRVLRDVHLGVMISLLLPWASYICAERIEGSGVIATVTVGLILGWYQHEIFTAQGRRLGTAVWEVLVHLLEAFVFILIGLSLRGVLNHLGGVNDPWTTFGWPTLAAVGAVVISRFVWVFGAEALSALAWRLLGRSAHPGQLTGSIAMGWAGMRGVVTLAIALSLPEDMPARELILIAAFAVILVTVLVQGTTLGPLIRLLQVGTESPVDDTTMTRAQAAAHMTTAQLAVVQVLASDVDGVVLHPRLLEQYSHRALIAMRFSQEGTTMMGKRDAHYEVVLAAISAGRREVLRLHRSGQIADDVLQALEHDLDQQEVASLRLREST